MGRFWDGILGYFCNVFSWAKLPASKLVGLESWFKNKFALSSCILNSFNSASNESWLRA